MARRTRSRATPLEEALRQLLRNLGYETKIKQHEVINRWEELVGSRIARVTNVERVRDGVLFVKVDNPTWRNELVFMKNRIHKKVEETVGAGIIRDIKFI